MRWLLFAAIGFLFWPGLWRVELTDSSVVRINRLTGAVLVTPLPNQAKGEDGDRSEDDGERQSICSGGAREDQQGDQNENLPVSVHI